MAVTAKLMFLRISPRKVRIVADLVRGKQVEDAINVLNYCPRRGARPLAKLLHSAVANADQAGDMDVDSLIVSEVRVDGGPTLRRFIPRGMGRATRMHKRTSHVTVVLKES